MLTIKPNQVLDSVANNLGQGPTPAGEAISRCEELRASNPEDRMHQAVITRSLSALFAMAGRFEQAHEAERESSRVLDDVSTTVSVGSRMIAAEAKELAGDRAGAEADLEAMWAFFRGSLGGGTHQLALLAAFRLAHVYCDGGRWDDAEECLAFYRDTSGRTVLRTGALRLAAGARVAAHRGELFDGVTLARRAVDVAEPTDQLNMKALIWSARAEVERTAGNEAEADEAIATALELYEQKGNVAAAAALRAAAPA